MFLCSRYRIINYCIAHSVITFIMNASLLIFVIPIPSTRINSSLVSSSPSNNLSQDTPSQTGRRSSGHLCRRRAVRSMGVAHLSSTTNHPPSLTDAQSTIARTGAHIAPSQCRTHPSAGPSRRAVAGRDDAGGPEALSATPALAAVAHWYSTTQAPVATI